MNIIDTSQLEAITGGECYSFPMKVSLIFVQVEVTFHFGDCAL